MSVTQGETNMFWGCVILGSIMALPTLLAVASIGFLFGQVM